MEKNTEKANSLADELASRPDVITASEELRNMIADRPIEEHVGIIIHAIDFEPENRVIARMVDAYFNL